MKSSSDDRMSKYSLPFDWKKLSTESKDYFCGCVVSLDGGSVRSLVDCSNCDGYGVMPIPWSELDE